jgi:2-polyprenyl-3-methyl-5-hydroxy-6-metoxy-1,4-benzoquinol methylase
LRVELAADILARHAAEKAIDVLDAGCGDAPLARRLARNHPSWSVTGLDHDPRFISLARERADADGLDRLVLGVADLTQPLERSFDAIACIEVLTEVPDDQALIETLAQALVPGGLLVVTAMERDWTPVLKGSSPAWKHQVRPGYTRDELTALAEDAGLAVQRITPVYRIAVRIAEEINDRMHETRLRYRAPLYPLLVAAAGLERRGLAFGRSHGWLLEARPR